MKTRVVLRGLIGGLGMGIIGALLPLTLFSGEAETADLIAHAAEIGVVMLIVLGWSGCSPPPCCSPPAGKRATSSRSCSPALPWAWRRRFCFRAFPWRSAVAAAMAGALVAALRAPLFAALFTSMLVQKETAAVIAVAVVASALLTALLALHATRAGRRNRRNHLQQLSSSMRATGAL